MADIECMFAAGECRGAYGVGLMQALLRSHGAAFHRRVSLASGVSVGAFTAVALAHADAGARLQDWTETMMRSDLVRCGRWHAAWHAAKLALFGDVSGGTGSLYSSDTLRALFRKILPASPLVCDVVVGVTPCSNNDTVQHSFSFKAGSHRRAAELENVVMASSAIPGVFPPQRLADGMLYSDGGTSSVYNLQHLRSALQSRPRALLVVGSAPWPSRGIGAYLGEHPGSNDDPGPSQSLGERTMHEINAYTRAFRLTDAVRLGLALGMSHDGLAGETRYRDGVFGILVSGPAGAEVAQPLDATGQPVRPHEVRERPMRVVFASMRASVCSSEDEIKGSLFTPWKQRQPYVQQWHRDGQRSAPQVARLLGL